MTKQDAINRLDEKQEKLFALSKKIWSNPELQFKEWIAVDTYADALEEEGFRVSKGIADMPTALVGEFGSGKPIIGILGEYDALSNLSQVGCIAEKKKIEGQENGHGCGHNLLGMGSLAAAIMIKDYLKESGKSGTVRFYGCPAEEGGGGKCYMVRSGCFDDVDLTLTWHPDNMNYIVPTKLLAIVSGKFKFKGIEAHASMSPDLGRSALDAAELMNVGANFLREHINGNARIHYAFLNDGGPYPNVVQSEAELYYTVRAPKLTQAKEIYDRLVKVANGAAMMTETTVEQKITSAMAETLTNITLEKLLHQNFEELGGVPIDDQDIAFAEAIREKMTANDLMYDVNRLELYHGERYSDLVRPHIEGKAINNYVYPYKEPEKVFFGSSDVGDVSQVAPCAQLSTACYAQGTPNHTWMVVSQAAAPLGNKAALHAGKVMGATAIDLIDHPELVDEAKKEFERRTQGVKYVSLLPEDCKPPVFK